MSEAVCECGCGAALPVWSRATRRFATPNCARRVRSKLPAVKADKARRNQIRETVPSGRQCRFCQALDNEVRWSKNAAECGACNRRRYRIKPEPSAPRGRVVEVIVLDESSDRERTVYRVSSSGWVSVAQKSIKVVEEPVVLTLPTETFVRTRR